MKEILKIESDCLAGVTLECSPSEYLTIMSALRYLAETPTYNVRKAEKILDELITVKEGGTHEQE